MKVHISFDLDDVTRRTLRQLTGQKGLATRAEVKAVVDGLFRNYLNGTTGGSSGRAVWPMPPAVEAERASTEPSADQTCNQLDHIFPGGSKTGETKCACGQKAWGQ